MKKISKLTIGITKHVSTDNLKEMLTQLSDLIQQIKEVKVMPEWKQSILLKDSHIKYLVSIEDLLNYNKKLLDKVIVQRLCKDVCYN